MCACITSEYCNGEGLKEKRDREETERMRGLWWSPYASLRPRVDCTLSACPCAALISRCTHPHTTHTTLLFCDYMCACYHWNKWPTHVDANLLLFLSLLVSLPVLSYKAEAFLCFDVACLVPASPHALFYRCYPLPMVLFLPLFLPLCLWFIL